MAWAIKPRRFCGGADVIVQRHPNDLGAARRLLFSEAFTGRQPVDELRRIARTATWRDGLLTPVAIIGQTLAEIAIRASPSAVDLASVEALNAEDRRYVDAARAKNTLRGIGRIGRSSLAGDGRSGITRSPRRRPRSRLHDYP